MNTEYATSEVHVSIHGNNVYYGGPSTSHASFMDSALQNPECKVIAERLLEINDPTEEDLYQIQQTVESMDEFKVHMMGNGYKHVIGLMADYVKGNSVRSDILSKAECDRVMEEIRKAKTEKSAQEFNQFLENQRIQRQNALLTLSNQSTNLTNSCAVQKSVPIFGVDCVQNSVSTVLPETGFLTDISNRLGKDFNLRGNSPQTLLNFRPQNEQQQFKSSVGNSLAPFKRTSLTTLDRFSSSDCNCASQTFSQTMNIYGAADVLMREANVKHQLNETILKASGDKFENDFSNNFEDLSYFLNTNSKVFSSEAQISAHQCADGDAYLNVIKSKCGGKSQDQIDQRLQKILGINQGQLSDKLKQIAITATAVDTGKKHPDGKPVLYTREDMDGQRRQLLSDLPELRFYDKMIYKIFSDSKMRKILEDSLDNSSPQSSIYNAMVLSFQENPSLIDQLDTSSTDKGFSLELKRLLTAKDSGKLFDLVNGGLSKLQDLYPGFKALMSSKDAVKKFRVSSKSADGSIAQEIEQEKKLLNEDFAKKCSNLQDNLAEAVCTEDDALITKADPVELEKLITFNRPDLLSEYDIYSNMLCMAKGKRTPAFSNLVVSSLPFLEQSDYYQRKMSEAKKVESPDMLSSYMRARRDNPSHKAYMDDSSRTVATRRNAYTGSGRLGSEILAQNSNVRKWDPKFEKSKDSDSYVAKKSNSSGPSKTESANEKFAETKLEEKSASAPIPQVNPQNTFQNFATTPRVISNNDSKERAEMKAAIRDIINEKEAPVSPEKMLSNVSNDQLLELNRLKALAQESHNELSRLTQETEERKLRTMQDQIKKLEEQRTSVARNLSDSSRPMAQEKSNGRNPASIAKAEASENPSPVVHSRAADPANFFATNISQSSKSSAPFVMKGEDLSSGLEVKANKVSEELLDYLSKNETQISSLVQIKDAGMLYKFKVLEDGKWVEKELLVDYDALADDVKKLIDQKIAQNPNGARLVKLDEEIKELRRSYSYAALKNIISEQTRK